MILKSVVAIAALKVAIKRLGITFAAETSILGPAIKQLGLTASASYSHIALAIELGYFLIEKDIFGNVTVHDGTGAFDGCLLEFFKTLTDDSNLADDAVWAFNKVLAENPSVSDTEVFDFYKVLAETASAADQYAVSLNKPTNDLYSATDSSNLGIGKVTEDTASVVESDYKTFYKALVEAPALVDVIDTLAFFKATQDTVGFTDAETLAFVKHLLDTVNATDDIDGAASILDDQEMQFFKNTTNAATVADVFTRIISFTRSFTETPNATDSVTLNYGPIFLNTTSLTDAGSLRSQGYCDFTFFAEDYVGASRTF